MTRCLFCNRKSAKGSKNRENWAHGEIACWIVQPDDTQRKWFQLFSIFCAVVVYILRTLLHYLISFISKNCPRILIPVVLEIYCWKILSSISSIFWKWKTREHISGYEILSQYVSTLILLRIAYSHGQNFYFYYFNFTFATQNKYCRKKRKYIITKIANLSSYLIII